MFAKLSGGQLPGLPVPGCGPDRHMSIHSLNHLSAIQCSQVRKRYLNASIIDVRSLLSQTIFDYRTHRLNLFNQTDSSWDVREHHRFVVHVELRRFLRLQTRTVARKSSLGGLYVRVGGLCVCAGRA